MQLTSRILVSLLLALGLLALSAGQTLAAVAANTQIVNRATMSYYDGTTTQTSSSTVTVTVALVPSPPGIEPGPQQSIAYAGADTQLVNSFTVIATSNGPDSYSLATAITASANTSGASAEVSPLTSITLGASVTL
ncbi:MAG: hypothetical protein K0A93_12630, partial [Desulfuromonadaceae bacterium]|nr:hypothetical protein [Desulfuromonadaceae bacterium]